MRLGYPVRKTWEQRFWERAQPDGDCLIWTGAKNPKGYGLSRGTLAHRVAYELTVGPVPEGKELDHAICHRRDCIAVKHLQVVTRKENTENRSGARVDSNSGIRGVWKSGRKWKAGVTHNGTKYYLGVYATAEEAGAAAAAKRLQLFTNSRTDHAV
jgi:hypothetical protein